MFSTKNFDPNDYPKIGAYVTEQTCEADKEKNVARYRIAYPRGTPTAVCRPRWWPADEASQKWALGE